MVNTLINVSAYQGGLPQSDGDRVINEGPLYNVQDLLVILQQGDEKTIPWTRDCISDLQKLAYDTADARELIRDAVTQGQYLNSLWCVQRPTGPWAACDAYRLVRSEWIEYAYKEMRVEYYIKFAIGKNGKILLLVSCHVSQ